MIAALESSEIASLSSLKKHRSLEDLQTIGIREEEEDASSSTGRPVTCDKKLSSKSARACGVNESFRAAIDRSYDPDPTNIMDPGMAACLHFRVAYKYLSLIHHAVST